ncbi:MAG TPA: hypothetical protein VD995_20700 [Azospirillum sp.]|nr:hypothetical protein [Azospirillum sp.]
MAIDAALLFSATTASTAAQRPPAASPKSEPMLDALKSLKAGDTVSVSTLGKALTGRAAEAFQYLDPKARGHLEKLVDTGAASADDVVRGLRALANTALFNRYATERPRDAQDQKLTLEAQRLEDDFRNQMRDDAALREKRAAIYGARESGEITEDEFKTQILASAKEYAELGEKYAKPEGAPDALGALANASFSKSFKQFAALDMGADDAGPDAIAAKEDLAAMEKLGGLGFDVTLFRDAFIRYAADTEIPGLGSAAKR